MIQTPGSDNDRVECLDALRGVGCLYVLICHAFLVYAPNTYDLFDVKRLGELGVSYFFCLSGFVMTRAYLHVWRTTLNRWRMWTGFARNRIARIFPLHWVVFCLFYITFWKCDVLLGDQEEPPDTTFMTAQAFLAGNVVSTHHPTWVGATWTLTVDLALYATLPILFHLTHTQARRVSVVCIPILYFVLLVLYVCQVISHKFPGFVVLLFASGVLLEQTPCLFTSDVFVFVLLAISPLIALTSHSDVYPIPFVLAQIWMCGHNNTRWLSNRVLLFIGKYSYSIYLLHWPVMLMCNWQIQTAASPAFLGFTVALYTAIGSFVTFELIEHRLYNAVKCKIN